MAPMTVYECRELFLMQAEQTKSIAQHLQRLESTMTQGIFTQQVIASPAQAGHPAFPHQGSLPTILIGPGQPGQAYVPVTCPAASSPGLSAPGQGYMTSPLPHHGPPSPTGPGQAAYTSDFASFFMPMQSGLSTTTTYSNQPPNEQLMRKQIRSHKEALMSGPTHVVPEIGRGYSRDAWVQAVKDWEAPDPSRCHSVPLKDWAREWHTSSGQTTKYEQRKMVALEFINTYVAS